MWTGEKVILSFYSGLEYSLYHLHQFNFYGLKMEESSVGKYIFYENGFEDVLKKKKIFFEDVKNYFYLNLKMALTM